MQAPALPPIQQAPVDPCIPSPCGPNSQCRNIGGSPSCSCLPMFIGIPPNCRPECVINSECPSNQACIREKCRDPCPGSCGTGAQCNIVNHIPTCMCQQGFTGDPFTSCTPNPIPPREPVVNDPCNPSPCGPNAECQSGLCTCLPDYQGDPYSACRPECVISTECQRNRACIRNKCVDPCLGTCGQNAQCSVVNHIPICSCASGYTGNPFVSCRLLPPETARNPCNPSPCGPNSQCREINGQAVCSCVPGFIGSPPACRPECVVSSECGQNEACSNQKCRNPCPGTCGVGARCEVVNHNPICSCPPRFTGDPFVRCQPIPETPVQAAPQNPCQPSPCGPNAVCQVAGDSPSCSCLPDYTGSPPNCRPECVSNSECASHLACINLKCRDPCPGSCGANAECRVVSHTPTCVCAAGFTGDPFTQCVVQQAEPLPQERPTPCVPSPCGPNAVCREQNGAGSCACLPDYVGNPYEGCRPECVLNTDCASNRACIRNRCQDPCPGTCGPNADCQVVNHLPSCTCRPGYTGDPFRFCNLQPPEPVQAEPGDPCNPSPCGPNSQCKQVNGQGVCSCLPTYIGSPPGCRPECVVSSECPQNRACLNQKCVDPCPGTCGLNARCEVINHSPICSCVQGFTGDAFARCFLVPPPLPSPDPIPVVNPCVPSPCGPNSQCRDIGGTPSCSCLPAYIGSPPNCRPECVISSECASNLACLREKCRDPCPGSCGAGAQCNVINHTPVCTCPERYTGDPFTSCFPSPLPPEPVQSDPCNPSPCGPNAQCQEGSCTCLPEYQGDPYVGCRPECVLSTDCSRDRACIRNKCTDPCPGTCGKAATCDVVNHIPICSCPTGTSGNPFVQCRPIPPPVVLQPCNPSPCGPNSQCREINGQAVCSCVPGFIGSPPACRPECVVSSECGQNEACSNQKCRNPCPATCGVGARCEVVNHNPICSCPPRFTGDPFIRCQLIPETPVQAAPQNPCQPSPCGANAVCQVSGESPSCSCLPNYLGSPPNCRPECGSNSECASHLACINLKCRDPCPGSCGANAECRVVSHTPTCVCLTGFSGDPFIQCLEQQCKDIGARFTFMDDNARPHHASPVNNFLQRHGIHRMNWPAASLDMNCVEHAWPFLKRATANHPHSPEITRDLIPAAIQEWNNLPRNKLDNLERPTPCVPSPCGSNADCREQNGAGSCTCLPDYVGNPYEGCRPECVLNSDCAPNRACIRNKCQDPCPGTCGQNADCQVVNHLPSCTCRPSFTGDPFRFCNVVPPIQAEPGDPCNPSPCGPNSQCKPVNGQGVCSCLPNYVGSPPGCRPECVVSSECPQNRACVNQKCVDPCPGTCGLNARCQIINHSPICSCNQGFTGDPFTRCFPIPPPPREPVQPPYVNPCVPSPCGPYSQCRDVGGTPSCSCLPTYTGSPPNCRPECVISSECPSNLACLREKCRDPCPGSCGAGAQCNVINHTPVCTCPEGYTGDPFTSCGPTPPPVQPVEADPCNPSPCGPNAQCNNGICTCLPEYQGDPYAGCRPECVLSTDCPRNRACIRNKCTDPCPGTCGQGAICDVVNHIPICSCPQGMSGNPFVECRPVPPPVVTQPCNPSPCGPNSQCREINGQAVCSCVPGFIGSPPACRPECVVSSECGQNEACSNQKCRNPCPGTCGVGARCEVVNHNPICSCPPRFTGDPFIRCQPIPDVPVPAVPQNPCQPSPCGPNAVCQVAGDSPSCSCLPDFTGSPPNCRPECVSNSECASHLACINQKCRDPCPGSCGANAECRVVSHTPNCICPSGFTGDPFTQCLVQQTPVVQEPVNPCQPSPCGANAVCKQQNSAGSCTCLPDYIGNPYEGCRPECVLNTDCPSNRACIRNKCQDPCPGTCGQNADCQVVNHLPSCTCRPSFTGDPFRFCNTIPPEPVKTPGDPCNPSPCGPNSQCREVNGQGVCSCLPNYIGSPPGCRPECVVSSECPQNRACVNQKCVDPCPGTCGVNARCEVVNHSPICSCSQGFTGDPFTRCFPIPPPPRDPLPPQYVNPCVPSPCGPYSQCQDVGGTPSCSCLPTYTGSPPNCRPECVISSECPSNLACLREKCRDPCPGSCGAGAQCNVINHTPVCTCPEGYTGDPFTSCGPTPPPVQPVEADPCNPSPCGPNAQCNNGICTCLPEYQGDPYAGCRPECVLSTDCPRNRACIRNKCTDPCPGTCGQGAICDVVNHIPICSCPQGMSGNPFVECRLMPPPVVTQPCNPSPCGPNSQCREINGQAVCSCVPGFIGSPPACRPECVVSSECGQNEACSNQKCRNPCPGTCGVGARCEVVNHNPICSCPPRFTGDPFIRCQPIPDVPVPAVPRNPCQPSPCGPNAVCQVAGDSPSCSCLPDFTGSPPNCRPECVSNSECASHLACINQKCRDPCPGSCGANAECRVVSHTPNCICPSGFTGDPFTQCVIQQSPVIEERPTPCIPSPCGSNAVCREQNGAGSCTCLPDYIGNPYEGCRPECVLNTDCPSNRACIRNKCQDPCPGTCGQNADCQVVNHLPSCTCRAGFTGDPFRFCNTIPPEPVKQDPGDPCLPSPCGPNSQCRNVNGQGVCSCLPNYIGSPPGCRPECVVSSECPQNRACVNQKCVDPCPGTCGLNARCEVVNHSPICSCQAGNTGDPFTRCFPIPPPVQLPPSIPGNPCVPSPCGPNSQCRDIGGAPSCSCLANYMGVPPNCRPECSINSECQSNRACIRERCQDPCPGSCGAGAQCVVINHTPVCTCPEGFTGDPFSNCFPSPPPPQPPPASDPCNPSPCGPNAQCNNGICTCLPEYQGDPYAGCRPECVLSTDCPRNRACIRNKCTDPCPGTCGQGAICDVVNHIPICSCPQGMSGNPFVECRPVPPPVVTQPCNPSPCGPNSQCREINGQAVCSCVPGFIGSPPACRPECVVSSECSQNEACSNQKCRNPCPGTCGVGARCEVVNHNPICSCPPRFTGDPFIRCQPIPDVPVPAVPRNPCQPSPCGPNAVCQVAGDSPSCSCLPDFTGSPPNCRPECVSNSECASHLACINQKCRDPCPGSCGANAECRVVSHTPNCICPSGFTGDPFVQCLVQQSYIIQFTAPVVPERPTPCVPSPCGPNAVCREQNGAGSCTCLPDYIGNPYEGCRPECVLNTDCPSNRACIRNKCQDPCPGTCGQNADCQVVNHLPSCTCRAGFTGDPFRFCNTIPPEPVKQEPGDPCVPSPCGPNSQCRNVNGQGVCSCLPNYIGSPPGCRPECVVSSECPQNRACVNQKCVDPCPGTCGLNARCEVINHSPICSCQVGFTGDPFTRCFTTPPAPMPPATPVNPCIPSPCGPNSLCQAIADTPSCSCLVGYVGSPPNCRPECVISSECSSNLACMREKCRDPCPGSCGAGAQCNVINHVPVCTCPKGFTGDPFTSCFPAPPPPLPQPKDPCNPSPCGPNSQCNNGICTCLPEFQGDPYAGCRPECVLNQECARDRACIRNRCTDPCPGTCGTQATCVVVNHIPTCTCPEGSSGNPFISCNPVPPPEVKQPCNPSPCGPNSQCREINGQAVCSCVPSFIGSPPSCRPECIVSSDCNLNEACSNQKCRDPCPGTCGVGARCQVINHNPICSCPPGFTGDPFIRCQPIPALPPAPPTNPCQPSPCGPNSVCQVAGDSPSCSCLPDFTGSPPNCRPECVSNGECASHLACINLRCRDPCPGSCGANAECRVVSHTPNCVCASGFTGDPFRQCLIPQLPESRPMERPTPCLPSPCGSNAVCREQNGAGSCTCLPDYIGNPYEGCRPECVLNTDCPSNRACIRNKCQDPCPGTCGQNADCQVVNHLPSCTCRAGFTGDPFRFCNTIPPEPVKQEPGDPCVPSPCGPNSQCRNVNGQGVCSCLPNYIGSPPGCRPECVVSSECPQNRACVNQKCVDPCPGTCGLNARCEVINHSPICSCQVGFTGDPFTRCNPIPPPVPTPTPPQYVYPCVPSPCGSYSQCRDIGGTPSCSCLPNYIGSPPNCRPECVINSECPSNRACIRERCSDPCPGSCGAGAQCIVINHTPVCTCPTGYTGDPFTNCFPSPPPLKPPAADPCNPSPCGPNAQCNNGICTCLPEYQGDPYAGCRPECVLSTDCPRNRACIRNKCTDPCPGTCGQGARCDVLNHIPSCTCPEGFTGDPFVFCREVPPPTVVQPCNPSPCGPNSQCREINGQAVCSCLTGYIGSPPTCRPECVVSSECPQNQACINQKCTDPCPGTCGLQARCNVINHNPICSCPPGFTGDPFTRCLLIPPTPVPPPVPRDPCQPSPCGPNAQCQVSADGSPSCTCLPGYVGAPPGCRPECVINSECASHLACINQKCRDPCPGSCGAGAECRVVVHIPNCVCPAGLTGDPFSLCIIAPPTPTPPTPAADPCNPSPCGSNARCRVENSFAICECLPEYHGNPYEGCRPECLVSSDCPMNRACIRNKCQDPCPGTCGVSAICTVSNHIPICSCPDGTTGDAFRICTPIRAGGEKASELGIEVEENMAGFNQKEAAHSDIRKLKIRGRKHQCEDGGVAK
ncbi:hypothetical protein ANN_21354 [Periplaneta americana]|uniref:EGF-like domain-containing protein n=1 Tax=Periplaneta americana TaxID=6978 RepID=A0ABQ8SF19_PERAM|nr:hypothetical protein ANN_21354 [Periplaneta americana]